MRKELDAAQSCPTELDEFKTRLSACQKVTSIIMVL